MLISSLVGIACIRIGQGSSLINTSGITGWLERQNPDAGTLKWLAEKLDSGGKYLPDRMGWVPYERAEARQAVQPNTFGETDIVLPQGPLVRTRAFRILYPDRTLARDMDKCYDSIAAQVKKPTWEAEVAMRAAKPSPGLDVCKDWNMFAWRLLPAVDRAYDEEVKLLCRHEALRINVALRRYKLANKEYPPSLDKLAPAFLKEVPPDPFSGQPFHYRAENGEWMFYSVGPNLKDDGGIDGGPGYAEGDIVFRSKSEAPK